jgi:hypothetical protein
MDAMLVLVPHANDESKFFYPSIRELYCADKATLQFYGDVAL